MKHEFKVTKSKEQTVYTLESATSGGTSAGNIASMDSTLGGMQRRNPPGDNILAQEKKEAPKLRNFVAKNAKMGGAGQHKDKKKAEKQGDVKHKNKSFDMAEGVGMPFRGVGGAFNRGDDERHDLDPSDWYIVKDGKMYKTSVYPNQEQQAISLGYSRTRDEAKAKAGQQGVAEGSGVNKTHLAMAYLKAVVMAPTGTPDNERIRNWQEELADEFDIEMDTAVLAQMLPQFDSMLQAGKLDKLQNRMASRGELYIESAEQGVAGPKSCWPGHRKVGTQPGTGKNAGKRVNDCEKIKKEGVAEGLEGKVVFSGTGANGGKYEIIRHGDDFMIRANGKHIDSYGSLQRAMGVLKNEVPGLKQGVAEDHEIQMASSELQAIAKNAVHLLDLVRKYSEQEGLDAWQQSKITKAADYLNSVLQSISGEQTSMKTDSYMESLMNMLERSVSQAQHNLMVGVAHNPAFAQKVKVKQQVGQEFARADQGHDISKLPIRVPKKNENTRISI